LPVPQEVNDLIQKTGNTFHAKVARWLASNDWHVVVSPYYMDQSQAKAREIDLIAEKRWPVTGNLRPSSTDVAVRLFIECKFVPSHSVFWFAEKDTSAAKELVCNNTPFRKDNTYTDKHHYLSQSHRVAKLFASSASKATENEPFYKALNQALNGMVSLRGQPLSTSTTRNVKSVPEFPVVVCSSFSMIYAADFYSEKAPEPITDNFQLEVQYAYIDKRGAQRDDYFLLDFVEFDRLSNFMEAIEEDAKAAAFLAH